MKVILVGVVFLALTTATLAATTPGTIISAAASVSYSDSNGLQMPQQVSDAANVLVIPQDPAAPVFLTLKSLFSGPSTVGRAVKLAGTITQDQNGVYWLEDGSVMNTTDQSGNVTTTTLCCEVTPTFLTNGLLTTQTGLTVVTGISQSETDGTRIIVPDSDEEIQSVEAN